MSTTSLSLGSSSSSSSSLGQGIDVMSFVQAAMTYDQANITNVQNQQTSIANQAKALTQITSELSSLQDAAYALQDPLGDLNSLTANSSNSSALTATASSAALVGAHTITVNSLATTSSYYTGPLNSSSTAISQGTFQIQVGSASPVTVTVDSTDNTLDGLVAAINKHDIGVRASVINDANGARLALVSESTGASGDIRVSNNTTGLIFNKAVTGTNASLVVDGVPISSSSNTVTGVINGVTLSLGAPTGSSPITLTISPDTTQATSAIDQFVSAYNTAIQDINSQFAVASDGSGGGVLEADNSLRQAQSLLLGATAYSASGSNGIANLASMGITLNDDGTLSVDTTTLQNALTGQTADVQSFLQNPTNGFATNLVSVLSAVNNPATGILGLDASGLAKNSQSLSQQLSDLQATFNAKEQYLIQIYSKVNATLQELPLLQSQMSQQLGSL